MASPYGSISGIHQIISSNAQYRLVETGPYRSPYAPYTYLSPGRFYTARHHRYPSVGLLDPDETRLGGLWPGFFHTKGKGLPLLYIGQSLEQVSNTTTGLFYVGDRFLIFFSSVGKILVAREDVRHLKRFPKPKQK